MSTTRSITANATPQVIAEWMKIFPLQTTETYTSSVTFMKQLTVVAISAITFERKVFSDINFTEENFGGIKLKILKKKCPDELAQFVSTALIQAFEAFEKKYLHQLALCLYDGCCAADNLVEYHIFEFSYSGAGVFVRSRGRDGRQSFHNIREQTLTFLKNITAVLADTGCHLPDTYDVSMRLFYNDDAPEGYQVAGFQPSSEQHELSPLDSHLSLGSLETAYHSVTGCTHYRDVGASNEPIPSQNPPEMTLEDDEFDGPWSSAGRVRCDCNGTDDTEDNLELLTCQVCTYQQHAVCYGVRRARVSPHVCARCVDTRPALAPTDRRLQSYSHNHREKLCIYRRALWHCHRRGRVTAAPLARGAGLARGAHALMRALDRHNVLLPTNDPTAPRQVNVTALKKTMDMYFEPDDGDIVDRLSQETFSQGNQPDPLGDVLNPMEKMALMRDEPKIVQNSPQRIPDDPILKECRETYSLSQQMDEDLPLSFNRDKNRETKEKRAKKRNQGQEFNMFKGEVKTKRAKLN